MRCDSNTAESTLFRTFNGSKDIIAVNYGHQVSTVLSSLNPFKIPAANFTRYSPCTKVTLSENNEHHQSTTFIDQMNAAITWLRRDGVH